MIVLCKINCDPVKVRLFVLLLGVLPSLMARGQTHWLNKFDGAQTCHIVDVVTDAAGNAYVTGDLTSIVSVSSGGTVQGTIPSAGAQDVLVAKFAPGGALLWAEHAGGPAVDLGLKLALGPSGLAITGIYTGTADLFGTTVSAQGGSTDLFVAMLNTADGQAQWVRTAGSPGYTDTPGGITVTSTGQVAVAGKFKGEAVFGSETLHGAINPATALPSFDVFIAAWAADGTFQWVKQGTGSKDCLAVDIVNGADDHLYVAGQFNDTLTFDVIHPNSVANNIFVAKFDPQGNELWFRKCGGGNFNQVSDLHWSAANDLLITGDQIGTLYWSDGISSTPVPSTAAHAYFILRVDASGALLNATSMGSTSAVHVASIAEQADSVVVFGEFECSFTGLQNAYGADGLFIATGSPDLFIAKHAAGNLAFATAQQFGGPGLKRAGAITNTPDGLLFAGAFTSQLFLPRGSVAWGDPAGPCSFIAPPVGAFCGDPNYNRFAWASGTGPSTGFLTKGWVEGRKPYDLWDRTGAAPCDRSARDGSVHIKYAGVEAPDSIVVCGITRLYSNVPFPRGYVVDLCSPDAPTVGPFSHQLWSTGSTGEWTNVFSTGWVSYSLFSNSGCRSWTDSVHVTMLPPPSLIVIDSTGAFNYDLSSTVSLTTCDPLVFWADQLGPGDQAYWVAGTDTTFSDTVHMNTAGGYSLHVLAANGCEASGVLNVQFFPHTQVNITGVVSQLVEGDTLHGCAVNCIHGTFSNTWYVDGVPALLPNGLLVSYVSIGGCNDQGASPPNQPVLWGLGLNGSGWYTIQSEVTVFEANCNAEVLYTFTFMDSIYVEVGETAELTFPGDEVYHCSEDTVMIPFDCPNCSSIVWNGPGIVWTSPSGDTVLVNLNGQYSAIPVSQTGGMGCAGSNQTVTVTGPPTPTVLMDPPGGVICSNDSVRLYTDILGSDYIWTGPGTAFLPNAPSIWVHEPGDYYLGVSFYDGCVLANGPATVSFFGSPIFSGPPAGLLCPGGTVQLQVEAGPGSIVQWQPPLFGTDPVQTVSSPGTYGCTVLSCGNSWNLFYTVVLSEVSADLGTGTFALCEGLPITLTAPPGGTSYLWLPSGDTLPQLTVSAPGTIELMVTDEAGCSAYSGPVEVVQQEVTQPATASGDSICAGGTAQLNASGSGEMAWYAGADTTELLAIGTSFIYAPAATDTIFLLQTQDGCPGAFLAVPVFVQDPPQPPVITGDTLLCPGDTLFLQASGSAGSQWQWATPAGEFSGPLLVVQHMDAADAGLYVCQVVLGNCSSDTAFHFVRLDDCAGVVGPGEIPNVITPNGDGVNDAFHFTAEGFASAELRVYNRWGQQVALVAGRNASWDGRSSYSGEVLAEGVYFYTIEAITDAGENYRKAGYVQVLR